jgi:hypothetical protein
MTKTFANQDRFTFFFLQQHNPGMPVVELLTRLAAMSEANRTAMNAATEEYHVGIGCTIDRHESGQVTVVFP